MENKQNFAPQRTAAELRQLLSDESGNARYIINNLFDEGTFVELGAYVRRAVTEFDTDINCDFEGVITGYGAVDGHLVYAFVQDFSRMKGALSEAHAKKIVSLYNTALNNNAPVIGVFDSAGAFVMEGVGALSGYGAIMQKVAYASGIIPQIALISGVCTGSAAVIADMFDFKIGVSDKGELSVNPSFILKEKSKDNSIGSIKSAAANGLIDVTADTIDTALDSVKDLLTYLPADYETGTNIDGANDNINRLTPEIENLVSANGYDMKQVIVSIADQGKLFETARDNACEAFTGFVRINGMVIGICANQPSVGEGKLTAKAALKIRRFITFCDNFKIPLLTLVDTTGFDISIESENTPYSYALAELAATYAISSNAKVTVVLGKAYGMSFTLLGSKQLGADIVYAVDKAEISIMSPESAVHFAWNDEITASKDPAAKKDELLNKWKNTMASPLTSARNGDIDDIISYEETRQRITAAFEMLAFKNGG
jgi:Acetyl-CoA carboxylase, carboxyltransferase component (subunits alpha and beta)